MNTTYADNDQWFKRWLAPAVWVLLIWPLFFVRKEIFIGLANQLMPSRPGAAYAAEKLFHVFVYAVLAVLVARACKFHRRVPSTREVGTLILIFTLIGGVQEAFQLFSGTRGASFLDVIINGCGSSLGIFLTIGLSDYRRFASVSAAAPSLRKNFSWCLAGNIAYSASNWLMFILVAKLGSAEMLGNFALCFAITAPIFMLSNLHLTAVQATDAANSFNFHDYFHLRLRTIALSLALIAAIPLFIPFDNWHVLLLIGLAKAMESVSEVFYGLFQKHEKMELIARSMFLRGPLSAAAVFAALHYTGSLSVAAAGIVAVWGCAMLVHDAPEARKLAGPFVTLKSSAEKLRQLAWLALPLGLVMMLISLSVNIPRYFIKGADGARDLGIFAALSYLTIAGSMIVNSMGSAAAPRLAKYYAARDRSAFVTLLFKLLMMSAVFGIVGILVSLLAGPFVLRTLYKPEYAAYNSVLIWLMFAGALGYAASFIGYGITAARRFRIQLPLLLVVCGSTAIVCALAVPQYGLRGAAWAMCCGSLVQLIGNSIVLRGAVRQL